MAQNSHNSQTSSSSIRDLDVDITSKQATNHVESISSIPQAEKAVPALDYSGASKKTDPREIALVKKLDWHIMVREFTPQI